MTSSPLLLAVGFMNPALLWGLGLAGVPIIIHLLSRRRYRRLEWGATRFLLEAERETRRRVRFEQWLLVVLRCLTLALLALLVARPFVRPGLVASLLGGRGEVARIVILDDSASLSYRTGAAAEFGRLEDAAARLLSWLHQEAPRDPVTVCLTSDGGDALIENAVLSETDQTELRERLRRREPVNTPADPGRVFARLAERLAASAADTVGADIYVLSDFQASDWLIGGEDGRSVFAPLRELGAEAGSAGPSARMVLIASGVQPRDNVALVDIALERPQTMAGFPAVVRAKVANYGGRAMEDLVMHVEIGDAPLPALPVGYIEAGAVNDVSLEVNFPDPGYHVLTLTVGPVDSFRLDDVRRRAVDVSAALAVLIVNGAPASDPFDDEVFLLRNALSPPGPLSSGLRLDVIDADEIEGTELGAYDVVLLCNVAPPSAAAVSQLRRYVRGGGGLALFLGGEVGDAEEYNRALLADGRGLLPLPLGRMMAPPGQGPGVGLVRTQPHAVTAAFPAGTDTLSEYVHFWRYFRCQEPAAAEDDDSTSDPARAVVLARYADPESTPALVEKAVARGRVLLFTSSVDLDWNDWARAPDGSYVVTMLEMVQYLARRPTHPGQFAAGEQLRLALSPDAYELGALFKSPAFPEEPAVVADGAELSSEPDEPVSVEGAVATRLGTYTVDLTTRAGEGEVRPLCVNLAVAESDLTAATPAALEQALEGIPHEFVAAADGFLQGAEQTRRELWPAVLALLAVVLMVEQALAWWFGAPRGTRMQARATVLARR